MNPKALRTALGQAPTGVAIISTVDAGGRPIAMTANSVVPIGSCPASLIWSLGRKSRSRAAFEYSSVFGVSLLEETQLPIASQMASIVENRFAGLDWFQGGETGVPLIEGSTAHFECVRTCTYELGDHVSFIGKIVDWQLGSCEPLLYLAGRYICLDGAAGQTLELLEPERSL